LKRFIRFPFACGIGLFRIGVYAIMQTRFFKGGFGVAIKASSKAKNQRKKMLYRVLTIVVVVVMVGGILLASLLSNLY